MEINLKDILMSLVAKSKVISELGLFFPSLRRIITDGWNDYINLYPDNLKVAHCATTRANIVHDHQIQRASNFAVENGFYLMDISGLKILLIGDYAIRFKKLTDNLLSRNHPTKQVEDFRKQKSLPGFSETHNLEVGYVLSIDSAEINKTCLVQPSGKGINWDLDLLEAETRTIVADLFEESCNADSSDGSEGAIIRGKKDNVVTIRSIKNED